MKICFLLSFFIGIGTSRRSGVFRYDGRYGNVGNLDPTGASLDTAKSDGLTCSGEEASRKMARNDLIAMNQYRDKIRKTAEIHKFDPAVIAGIISRESRAGKVLNDGWGDHENAFGLMQIDKRHHRPNGEWNSLSHLIQGTAILIDSIKQVQRKMPQWSLAQQLQGGVAAYNFGIKNVRSWRRLDRGTTHNDYSNDVIARAIYYRENGYN